MKRELFVASLALIAQCQCQEDDTNVVTLTNGNETGWIKGELGSNALYPETQYYRFHGIPYAEPPVKELRFMMPVPYDTSKYGSNETDPYDASRKGDSQNPLPGHVCPQLDEGSSINVGSTNEDCLRLSIYTPKINPTANETLKPVLVWIHGGHFISGSGSYQYYGPERFMKDNDIVMVSINYRLGTLGFLSLGTPELPGNAGLWDQVEALKWIQTNIKYFGGDNKKVTIMGESAGSWSVMYQLLSPASAGLFQRVISQSGTPMSPAYHEYTQDKANQ